MITGIVGDNDPIDAAELDRLFHRWNDYSHIALAVSGGADSTALMRLAVRWRDERSCASLPTITILTVDHDLRPEAAAEAEWVKQQAADLGLTHTTLRWEGPKPKSDLQAAARDTRYGLMTAYCHAHNIPALATAHTRDDQIETFIMRLARGSGLDGLSAISEISMRDGIVLLRPLLSLSRPRIEAYLRTGGHSWIDDPSNQDERFERVRMRRAIPALEAAGLERAKLALSAKRLNRARQALDAITKEFLKHHLKLHPAGCGAISITALLDAPEEIALKALTAMARGFGGRNSNARLAKLEAFYGRLRDATKGATLGGCRFIALQDQLFVMREFGRMDTEAVLLGPGQTILWDGRFRICTSKFRSEPVSLRPLGPEGLKILKHAETLPAIPRPAALALPSFWIGETLCFAPCVTFRPANWQPDDSAEFINLRDFPSQS